MKAVEQWTLIYNPTSGRFRPAVLERIQRALRDAGIRSDAIGTTYAGHAIELARRLTGVDRVACYSGDGTLNEVATGLLGRNLPIAFLPGGTANVMAYELGLPHDPVRAALSLARGRPRPVRPGTVNPRAANPVTTGGTLFLLMAGIGFDAAAVRLVSSAVKARLGRGAYVWSGVRALAEAGPRLRLTCADGAQLEARWIVAARARCYGGRYVVHPAAGLEAPALGIAAVGSGHLLAFLAGNLGLGLSKSRPGRRLLQETRIVVDAEQPVDLQLDGDYRGRDTCFEIAVSDSALQLCYPAP